MNLYYTVPALVFLSVMCLLFGAEFMRGGRSVLGVWLPPVTASSPWPGS